MYHIYLHCTTIVIAITTLLNRPVLSKSDMGQVIVEFDPYVSILDKTNRSRYNVEDLQVLLSKVATRFPKIYIEFTDADLELQDTSLLKSPLVAATKNCFSNSSRKIEVWLGLYRESSDQINARSLLRIFSIVRNANYICNGTVTHFFIPQIISPVEAISIRDRSWFLNPTSSENSPAESSVGLGLLIPFPYICDEDLVDKFSPNLIVFHRASYITENLDINILHNCKRRFVSTNKSIEFGVMNGYPDTMSNNILNVTHLVSSWTKAVKWSKEFKNFVVLSRAFDTPYKHSVEEQTMGWWRVVENCVGNNMCKNTFVAKANMMEIMDSRENPKNYAWLKSDTKFYENTTGLIFYENDLKKLMNTSNLLNLINANNHSRVLILDENSKEPLTTSVKILPNTTNDGLYLSEMIEKGVFRYSFDAEMCKSYTKTGLRMQRTLFQQLKGESDQLCVFHFKEDLETIKLGARRMLEQRLVLFKQCKQMLLQSGNAKTEIGFALIEYPKPFNFFQSPWALQNIVLYWQILNQWASKQNNIVIFLPAVDRDQVDQTQNLGWWTPTPYNTAASRSTVLLTNKQIYAQHLSKLRFPPQNTSLNMTVISKIKYEHVFLHNTIYQNVSHNTTIHTTLGLNHTHLALIVIFALVFCATTIVGISFLIRQHYKKRPLTLEEINEFFEGNSSVEIINGETCTKAPYDKAKYEIDENQYSLEDENVLGTGEFGRVLRGKVETPNCNMNVAVKTTNPQTNHVSALKGLLSEIKLLAYIGKHRNIIELVGANTTYLKSGKIWIFLELCELGSLQKYIRNIREHTSNALVEYSVESGAVNMANTYVNGQAVENNMDISVGKDLYRWSTEICCGMEYLAKKHVVHADLATRNVLLSLKKEAKICDFGLSRRMYNYADYVKTNQEPLPWKWMAPESLRFMQFSEKSDVWSFGITLWELYSLGEMPYQGLSWDLNFSNLLDRGLRPSEPAFNEREMYQLMLNCWNGDPEQRPSFSELYTLLTANG